MLGVNCISKVSVVLKRLSGSGYIEPFPDSFCFLGKALLSDSRALYLLGACYLV